jgi:hypothetical protein
MGFYYSDTYDLSNSLQTNMISKYNEEMNETQMKSKQKKQYIWNYNIIKEFKASVNDQRWIKPIIHGFIEQKSIYFF